MSEQIINEITQNLDIHLDKVVRYLEKNIQSILKHNLSKTKESKNIIEEVNNTFTKIFFETKEASKKEILLLLENLEDLNNSGYCIHFDTYLNEFIISKSNQGRDDELQKLITNYQIDSLDIHYINPQNQIDYPKLKQLQDLYFIDKKYGNPFPKSNIIFFTPNKKDCVNAIKIINKYSNIISSSPDKLFNPTLTHSLFSKKNTHSLQQQNELEIEKELKLDAIIKDPKYNYLKIAILSFVKLFYPYNDSPLQSILSNTNQALFKTLWIEENIINLDYKEFLKINFTLPVEDFVYSGNNGEYIILNSEESYENILNNYSRFIIEALKNEDFASAKKLYNNIFTDKKYFFDEDYINSIFTIYHTDDLEKFKKILVDFQSKLFQQGHDLINKNKKLGDLYKDCNLFIGLKSNDIEPKIENEEFYSVDLSSLLKKSKGLISKLKILQKIAEEDCAFALSSNKLFIINRTKNVIVNNQSIKDLLLDISQNENFDQEVAKRFWKEFLLKAKMNYSNQEKNKKITNIVRNKI